jgi:DnaJ-class molecular chaperone
MPGECNIKNMRVIKEKCSQCEGVGKVKWECGHEEMCLKCKGSGQVTIWMETVRTSPECDNSYDNGSDYSSSGSYRW